MSIVLFALRGHLESLVIISACFITNQKRKEDREGVEGMCNTTQEREKNGVQSHSPP